ncbi:MAG: hypothetical protein RMM08_06395 [Armatimonadota bacterium]|nr:hypothetical protein [Armatimonadota bacterium]
MRTQISPWVAAVILAVILILVGTVYYVRFFRPPAQQADFSKLDPRDPYGMMVFKAYDDYYRQHPQKRPRNWPPEQFRPENIARLQEEARRKAEEEQKKLSEAVQQYLQQQTQTNQGGR